MPTVTIKLPHHEYPVRIDSGLLTELGSALRERAPHAKTGLLMDANVEAHFGGRVRQSLINAGYEVIADSRHYDEKRKSLDTVRDLYDVCLNAKLERKSPVVSLGGGIVGDTAGFVAATYLRGVPFVQVPTTLLAMVDASVGGKVGVNVPQGKNLIGAFHQPVLVLIDVETLKTLPERDFRCGLAECIKHGMIRDESLLSWIEENQQAIQSGDAETLVEFVRRNVAIKAAVVMEDEKESGVRAHLNFGHTFAHAIEATQSFASREHYLHGEAVAIGVVAASQLAVNRKMCSPDVLSRLKVMLEMVGLPIKGTNLASVDALVESMTHDKKVKDGKVRLVLPVQVGEVVVVDDASADEIAAAWSAVV